MSRARVKLRVEGLDEFRVRLHALGLHLLCAHLSTDARVEHLPVPTAADPKDWEHAETLCGRTGRWTTSRPGRGGGICSQCLAKREAP